MGIVFYDGAVGALNDNVEFDKTKFRAYADAVTLGKMLLLQETNPLGGSTVGSGQLSALMSAILTNLNGGTATTYDWSLLNQIGDNGGNIFAATLPKPERDLSVTGTDLDAETDPGRWPRSRGRAGRPLHGRRVGHRGRRPGGRRRLLRLGRGRRPHPAPPRLRRRVQARQRRRPDQRRVRDETCGRP